MRLKAGQVWEWRDREGCLLLLTRHPHAWNFDVSVWDCLVLIADEAWGERAGAVTRWPEASLLGGARRLA